MYRKLKAIGNHCECRHHVPKSYEFLEFSDMMINIAMNSYGFQLVIINPYAVSNSSTPTLYYGRGHCILALPQGCCASGGEGGMRAP